MYGACDEFGGDRLTRRKLTLAKNGPRRSHLTGAAIQGVCRDPYRAGCLGVINAGQERENPEITRDRSDPPGLEDERVTPEEEAAVAEAEADIAAGRTVSLDEVLREFE